MQAELFMPSHFPVAVLMLIASSVFGVLPGAQPSSLSPSRCCVGDRQLGIALFEYCLSYPLTGSALTVSTAGSCWHSGGNHLIVFAVFSVGFPRRS
jgi:uncharacterized protein (DUF486 family)